MSGDARLWPSLRLTAVAVLCAGATGLAAVTPAQADRIADARARCPSAPWARMQSDGERLERVVERYNGARLRLAQTLSRIHNNEVVLRVTRVNLAKAEGALDALLISAYKSPAPDPLEAALSARNFGEVLEQFSLLDRTNAYNANMLGAIRVYRGEIVRRQRILTRERRQRTATVTQLQTVRRIFAVRGSRAAPLPGSASEVRRLLEERRTAELAASGAPAHQGAGAAGERGARRGQRHRRRQHGRPAAACRRRSPRPSRPAPSALRSASRARRRPRPAPLRAGSTAPASSPGPAQAGIRASALSGALWSAGTRVASRSELAPGDLVFFDGLGHVGMYIGGGQFVHAPHSGDVVKITSLGSRSDYLGAVRISG